MSRSLDPIDAAFLSRWPVGPAAVLEAGRPTIPPALPTPPSPEVAAEQSSRRHAAPLPPCPAAALATTVADRLLEAAWPEWNGLAAHVEAARQRGRRVVAVAGGEPREGRSTLVECLVRTLLSRGRDVVTAVASDMPLATSGGGPTHDKRIVVVDAGIWFPPGPIRRHWLAASTLGCDAAILVRRADRRPATARGAALESLGVEVLGEVLTFTDPAADSSDAGAT